MEINNLEVNIKFLSDKATLPQYSTDGSMGMDIRSISVEYDEKIDCYLYHTGLSFEIPEGYGMILLPRSSNRKKNCYLPNSVGIVDSDYRGEVILCYKDRISTYERMELIYNKSISNTKDINLENNDYLSIKNRVLEMTKNLEFAPYKVGEKLGQLIIIPYPKVKFNIVEELNDTERGNGGFGSTGK